MQCLRLGSLPELYQKAVHQQATGQPETSTRNLREQLLAIGKRFGVDIPLDRPEAEIMLCVPRTDIEHYPGAVAALAQVMQYLDRRCTFRSDALVAENYGYYAGSKAWQRDISLRFDRAGTRCKASILLVPECGHAYAALRWERPNCTVSPSPQSSSGHRIPCRRAAGGPPETSSCRLGATTFQDPCESARKGGINHAPRS